MVTFGAIPGGSDLYNPGVDLQHVPPPAWHVSGWFPLDDPSYSYINRLQRDFRDVSPPKNWYLVTENEPNGIARWDPDRLPEGEFRMNGLIDMKRDSVAFFGENDTLVIEWNMPLLDALVLDFSSGWNMVSSPLLPTEVPAGEVFGADMGVFRYLPEDGTYDYADYARDGEGYWIWADAAYEIPIAGGIINGYRWAVYRGWNLIGATGEPVSVSDIEITPSGGIVGDIFEWDGLSYVSADSLIPGNGYWMLCSSNGTLHVPMGYRRYPKPRIEPEWTGSLRSGGLELVFGYSPSAKEGIGACDIALPPLAPNTTGRLFAFMREGFELSTDISSSNEWEITTSENIIFELNAPMDIVIEIDGLEYEDGELLALDPGIHKLTAESILPNRFEILGSIPNPFNSNTEILLTIPSDGELELEVFDLLGRRVSGRVIQVEAGLARIPWDGYNDNSRELPSGIYLARVKYEGETRIARLMLIK